MLDSLEKMSVTQQKLFRDVCNKLLAYNFLARDKKDNKENYYFLMSYKDIFDEFFNILGLEIELNQQAGAVMLHGSTSANTLKLKRDETLILLILRLLYHEKAKEASLNDNIVCQVLDIHEKYDLLEIKRKLNKTDLVNSLRLFRRYNLIEATGDLTTSACKIVIMPTILMAIPSEDINTIYQTILRLNDGGDDSEKVNEN